MNNKTRYIKTPSPKETDWLAKEARELFCKTVNTLIMGEEKSLIKDIDWEFILLKAKLVVDKAFENYPDKLPEEEELQEELPL